MKAKPVFVACALMLTGFVQPTQAMIRHVAFFEPPVPLEQFDGWYFGTHSRECIRFFGPWLRRYETYRAERVPGEADRFNVYRGRYTELWYDSVEAFREADPNARPYSPAAWGGISKRGLPTARLLIPAMPTEDFLRKEPMPRQRPFLRWLVMVRYPEGVSLAEGERWYTTVHAQEQARLPGLLKFVSYKGLDHSPLASRWIRMSELWFQDYPSWRKAVIEGSMKYSPPPWAREGQPWLETASTFVGYEPDMDFLKGPR